MRLRKADYLIVLLVIGAAAWRLDALRWAHDLGQSANKLSQLFELTKREVLSSAESDGQLAEKGQLDRRRVQWQRFDAHARVRLLPGPDGYPGRAKIDDNANGVVDDAGELGATHSDDICVVESSSDPPSEIKPSVVLQRGAYVPVPFDDLYPKDTDRTLSAPDSVSGSKPHSVSLTWSPRAVVHGYSRGRAWSFLVDLPADP